MERGEGIQAGDIECRGDTEKFGIIIATKHRKHREREKQKRLRRKGEEGEMGGKIIK